MILLIDNYDSFSYNLYQLVGEFEPNIRLSRNDEMTAEELRALQPERIILSPGPGRPEDAGITMEVVTALGGELAMPEADSISKEDLVAADPEVIFVVYMAYAGDDPQSVMDQQLSLIQDDPALQSRQAVKNGKVHLIMLGDMYASGPRTLDGLKTLAQGMYP